MEFQVIVESVIPVSLGLRHLRKLALSIKTDLVIKKIKLSEYQEHPDNPRIDVDKIKHLKDSLKYSLETWGYVEPIVVNERTKRILGGHQRYKILKSEGITEVDAVVVDLPENEEKLLLLALNKISAKWDYDKLANVLKQIRSAVDINQLGFDKNIMSVLLEQDKIHQVIAQRREKFLEKATEEQIKGRVGNHTFIVNKDVYKRFLEALKNKPAHQIIVDGINRYLKKNGGKS
jgi:hypothetical protein